MNGWICGLLGLSLLLLAHDDSARASQEMKLRAATSYRTFATAGNSNTLDLAIPSATRDKLGRPMSRLKTGDALKKEIAQGYVTMFATWAQTSLRVPLGWYAVESKQNVEDSLIFSPDEQVKIVARAAMENQPFQTDREAFAKLQQEHLKNTESKFQTLGFSDVAFQQHNLSPESFILRADNLTDKTGRKFSYLEHISQRATLAERRDYWAKVAAKQPLSPLQLPLSISMLIPSENFEKSLPLLGAMVRDAGLNWTRERTLTVKEFAAQVPDAAKFLAVAAKAVELAKAGNPNAFFARFPTAFEDTNRKESATFLRQYVTPILKQLPPKAQNTQIDVADDRDPTTPLQVTMVRGFKVGPTFPAYVVVMERRGQTIHLIGISTSAAPGA